MKKKISIAFWWFFWILFLEFVFKFFVYNTLFDKSLLTVILFSVPWIVIFSILSTVFNEKINKILTITIMTILLIYTLAQIVYFNFYNSIFSCMLLMQYQVFYKLC